MKRKEIISNVGFGCVSLTTLPFANEAIRLLETAYDAGIRLFDTAPLYGNGYSEAIVGKFISNKRSNIILTTKFGLNSDRKLSVPVSIALPLNYVKKKVKGINPPIAQSASTSPSTSLILYRKIDRREIEISFNTSIKVLKTDYIDNFLLHEAVPSFLTEEALYYLLNLKKDGKVLKIGVASGYINLLDTDNFKGWDILQYENNPLFNSDLLVNQFPGKHHIYHSVLKGIKNMHSKDLSSFEISALLLMYGIKKNPNGQVLFATTKSKTIRKNIKALEKFKDMDVNKISSLVNAIY